MQTNVWQKVRVQGFLKAKVAGSGWLILVTFGTQAHVEFGTRAQHQLEAVIEKPEKKKQTHSEVLEGRRKSLKQAEVPLTTL